MTETKISPVGVTVVSGFLGSGKTTLLRRIVSDPQLGPRSAVIVNDVGELGLDPELVKSAGSTPTLRVAELVSGCICCTLQGELQDALRTLVRGEGLPRRPEHIFIEPSGIARASEVSFAVNAIGQDDPLYTDAVVTLVDAWNARRAHREHEELFEDQLRSADLVILNKRDLVPVASAQEELLGWLRPFAPRATFMWTERADVDLNLLLGRVDLTAKLSVEHAQHEHAAHDIGAVTLPVPFPVDKLALEDFLDDLADRIFRIKGIVDARWEGEGAATATLVQAVGDRVELDRILPESALYQRPRRLIFIGSPESLAKDELEATLASQVRVKA